MQGVGSNPASTLRHVMNERGYSKRSACFGDVVTRVDDACRECAGLEHDVGTNLPSMVDDLRSDVRWDGTPFGV